MLGQTGGGRGIMVKYWRGWWPGVLLSRVPSARRASGTVLWHCADEPSSPQPLQHCRGDHNLRDSYSSCLLQLLAAAADAPAPHEVSAVLDIGCAAGLSSSALTDIFPAAHITGIDLSPHMIAVGRYHQEQREVRAYCTVFRTALCT